jgi:hypothetical protein
VNLEIILIFSLSASVYTLLLIRLTFMKVLIGRATAQAVVVAGFPPRRPKFVTGSGQLGFVVDEVALGQVFSQVLRFPLPMFIPPNFPS